MIAIRQFDAKDFEDILQIEKSSFSHPYNKSIFLHLLSAYNTGFLVAERYGKVIGYIIYSADHSGTIVSIAAFTSGNTISLNGASASALGPPAATPMACA